MDTLRTTLVEGDGLAVPPSLRAAMGVKPGDAVVVELHGDELRIRPGMSGLGRAQALLAPYAPKPGEPFLSDQLIADRRAEAHRE